MNPLFPHPAPNDTSALAAIEALFGPLLPDDEPVAAGLMHRLEQADRTLEAYRVQVGQPAWLAWTLHVVWPQSVDPEPPAAPVLFSPDGGWPHVVHAGAIDLAIAAGVAVAWFDRTELAWDRPDGQRQGPVQEHWPQRVYGALMIWAWGLNRSLQALQSAARIRMGGAAVVGHSRGGKAALLAAVLEPRWRAVISHNSGLGGVAPLDTAAPDAESLADLVRRFPHWVAPDLGPARRQAAVQAVDAPTVWLQTLAPRGLCVLQAEDDAWANPQGTAQVVERLRSHWRALEAPAGALQHHSRRGGHAMTLADWQRAVAFTAEFAAL